MTGDLQPGSDKAAGMRLSIMMFLQFFVWGAWYVTVGNFMNKEGMGDQIGNAYTVGPIAAIISPFFLGMIADRFFSTERVLAAMHVLGGIAIFAAPYVVDAGGSANLFVGLLFVHMLFYMPTLGLTNTIAFHHMSNPEKQFPIVRVFGTIGWIVAGIVVSKYLQADESALPLKVAGGAGIALGIYSLTLPHTPPPAKGTKASIGDVLGFDALSLLKSPSFLVFIISSLLICIPLAGYYAYAQRFVADAGFADPAFTMTFGQMSEILFMVIMPLFFIRLGIKWMLVIGMLAWTLRYGLFAAAADQGVLWMILFGIILHGICYDFFFVTGFIYVDKKAPRKVRGQAQGFLVLVTQGIGLGIGAQVFQRIVNGNKARTVAEGEQPLPAVELTDAAIADLTERARDGEAYFSEITNTAAALREQHGALMEQVEAGAANADALTIQADTALQQASQLLLHSYDYRMIWLIPCIAAGAIMIFFTLFFKDDTKKEEGE